MPSKIAQHATFLPCDRAPIVSHKPGNVTSERQGFYTAERRPERGTFLTANIGGRDSVYQTSVSRTVAPVNYKNPQKPLIPAALRRKKPEEFMEKKDDTYGDLDLEGAAKLVAEVTAEAQAPPPEVEEEANAEAKDDGENAANDTAAAPAAEAKEEPAYNAKHWGTVYRSTTGADAATATEACKHYKRLRGPPFAVQHPPVCLSDDKPLSFYQSEFGLAGSRPMDRFLLPTYTYNETIDKGALKDHYKKNFNQKIIDGTEDSKSTAMRAAAGAPPPIRSLNDFKHFPVLKTDLTRGTTKATYHIPGYQGFLPGNTNNVKCAAVEAGLVERDPGAGISETFHTNMPSYSGHAPKVAINDRGTRQVTKMSTFGRDYGRCLGADA